MATESNISVFGGETLDITRTVTDSTGAVFNLTGYTAELMVKENKTDIDSAAKITKSGTISTPANGTIVFSLTTTDTNLTPKTYYFDIKITSASKTKIINYGQFIVNQIINRV